MKKIIGALLVAALAATAAFAGYKLGESKTPAVNAGTEVRETPDVTAEIEATPVAEVEATPPVVVDMLGKVVEENVRYYDMTAEEIEPILRGKGFQMGFFGAASRLGGYMYFPPEGNEYYLFTSPMDGDSRVRAEYGTWELDGEFGEGYFYMTTLKLVEWVGGYFDRPYGSTGSRFELRDYDEVLTDVYIEDSKNFHMFTFRHALGGPAEEDVYYKEEYGFYCMGTDFYHDSWSGDREALEFEFGHYFKLLGEQD